MIRVVIFTVMQTILSKHLIVYNAFMTNEFDPKNNPEIDQSSSEGREEIKASVLLTHFVNDVLARECTPYFECLAKDVSEITLTKESFVRLLKRKHNSSINKEGDSEKSPKEEIRELVQRYEESLTPEELEDAGLKGLEDRINDNEIEEVNQLLEDFISRTNFSHKWEHLAGDTRIRIVFVSKTYIEGSFTNRLSVVDKYLTAINRIHITAERFGGKILGDLDQLISGFVTSMEENTGFSFEILFRDEGTIKQT